MINLEGQSQVCALGIVYRNEAQRYTVFGRAIRCRAD